jgi:YidC/Oxa1 family membrane protein insertase
MDKRVLYAVIVSMGILLVWTKLFPPVKPPAQQQQPAASAPSVPATGAPQAQPPAEKSAPAPEKTAEKTTPATEKAAEKTPEKAAEKTAPKPPAIETTFEQPGHYRASFTSWGAAPEHWVLLAPQYKEDDPKATNKQARPIDLVRTASPNLPVTITFPSSAFTLPVDAAWTPQPSEPGTLVYTWDSGDVHVEKRFTQVPGTYEVHLAVTVENRGDKVLSHHFQIQMHGWQDPTVKPGGFLSRRVSQTEGLCDLGGKLKKANLEGLQKKALDEIGSVRWIGVGEQYFVTAAALKQSAETRRCDVFGTPDGAISAILTDEERKVEAHGKTTYELALFFGPKILSQLDAVKAGGVDAGMGTAVDYGWTEAIARPMLAVLKGIHVAIPNWGFAIIILTILLKALTWWPTSRSMKSMKSMAKLKPEMDKLREKYGNDKQRMNVEVMNLYKQHGVNPLGGCLPVLIQMPIYIALYAMLGNSVELYRSGFVLWIRDLTAPDPYYVLPILTGVIMFVQQRLSPAPPDPQQKTMMYIMPVMFTAFSIFLPAGLTVYILTNTILTMLQQWWNNRGEKPARPKVLAKPARA